MRGPAQQATEGSFCALTSPFYVLLFTKHLPLSHPSSQKTGHRTGMYCADWALPVASAYSPFERNYETDVSLLDSLLSLPPQDHKLSQKLPSLWASSGAASSEAAGPHALDMRLRSPFSAGRIHCSGLQGSATTPVPVCFLPTACHRTDQTGAGGLLDKAP